MSPIHAGDLPKTQPPRAPYAKWQRHIDLATAHFLEHGTFPNLPDVKRQFAWEGEPLEYDATDPLPGNLGFIGLRAPQNVTLNVAGLAQSEMARSFLEDVVRLAELELAL